MPLLPKTKVTQKLPAFFFGSKSKRKNSKSISHQNFNEIEPELDSMSPSKSENKKSNEDDHLTSSSSEGVCTCKRPRTPLSDLKVRDPSPRSIVTKLASGSISKGLRTRKSSPHKSQTTTGSAVKKTATELKNSNCEFTPIKPPNNLATDTDNRAFSPMDVGSRTCSPMDYSTVTHNSPQSAPQSKPEPSSEGMGVAYTITRPKVPSRSNSRIGISLDMVDLWDPESDSESESPTKDYDRINGVAINPRKTIDFSELRRNKEYQDIIHDDWSERIEQNFNEKNSVNSTSRNKRASKAKPRVRMTQTMKALLTYPPSSTSPTSCPSKINFPETTKQVEEESRISKTNRKEQIEEPKRTLPILRKPNKTLTPESKAKNYLEENSPSFTKCRMKGSSPTIPSHQRVLNVTYDFSEEVNDSPSLRRVNFNNFVTVEDGEMSTLELLKSSNNSAQLIKQKYLGQHYQQRTSTHVEPHVTSDLNSREDIVDLQLAY